MATLKSNTAYVRMFLMVLSSDHLTGATGLGSTPAVQLSKSGAAFGAAAGAVAEIASGWYKVSLTTTDTNTTGDMAYHITCATADPTDFVDQVQSQVFTDLNMDANGNVAVISNVKKNTAWNNFMFTMTDAVTHAAKSGLTPTSMRAIDGNAFASTANSVTEVGSGVYKINLATTDTNGNFIQLLITASGADPTYLELITQP